MASQALSKSSSIRVLRRSSIPKRFCVRNVSDSSASNEERYIQYSKVPTNHFQRGLPRLPIPKLEQTLERYLASLRPVCLEEDYQHSRACVEEFKNDGQEIDKLLREKDRQNKHTSYISGPWFDMYLKSRLPLVLNYNPFIAFKEDPHIKDQALRAANFVRSSVRFRAALKDNILEPEVFHLNPAKSDTQSFRNIIRYVPSSLSWYAAALVAKAFALDMSQYGRLFNSTRVPLKGKDELVTHDHSNGHIVVMRRGHFYSINAVQENGLAQPVDKLCSQLLGILSDPRPPPTHPVGYLTSMDRDQWAELREELSSNAESAKSLSVIDSAMFVLCLDDHEPTTVPDYIFTMLHNYGANRWFDKSFSLLLTKGGHAAVNFEHAWGDGVAILRYFNEVYKDKKVNSQGCQATMEGVANLDFPLTANLKSSIEKARSSVEEQCNNLSTNILQYQKYGKKEIKKFQMSPDAIMQLAFQIAYYRQYKHCVPTYESCSTAAFRHGRTETIRPASQWTKACAEAFDHSHPAGSKDMLELIKKATTHHSQLVKEAAMGKGFDRHLFALKALYESENRPLPSIFTDPMYSHMNHIILSTSTLSSDAVLIGGFAPVTSDGYGVGYGIEDSQLGTQVTTYSTRDGADFVQHLETVLDNLHTVLSGNNFK